MSEFDAFMHHIIQHNQNHKTGGNAFRLYLRIPMYMGMLSNMYTVQGARALSDQPSPSEVFIVYLLILHAAGIYTPSPINGFYHSYDIISCAFSN